MATQVGEARLAIDHRHLAEGLARVDGGDELRFALAVALAHLDLALEDHQHEVAGLALADELGADAGAVDVHELGEQAGFRRGEVLQQRAARDQRVDLAREPARVAEIFEMRETLG